MLLYQDHQAVVYAVAFSPDGAALASGAKDGSLLVRTGSERAEPRLESGPRTPAIHALAYLPDGGLVVGHAKGWHVSRNADETVSMFFPSSASPTTALAVLDSDILAVGTGDRLRPSAGAFELWNVKAMLRFKPDFPQPNGVRAVAVCPAKKLVAWATGHRKVSVWDIRRQSPTDFPITHTSPAVALSPDGSVLAAAVDWHVRLFDVEKKRERAKLDGHKGQVTALAISPDGTTLVSGSTDLTVRMWDVATGRERVCYQWPVGRVYCVAYAPDGLRVAAGGDLGAVVVWDTE